MLEGIAANDIIVGAYATRDGVCPMLAAHRAGGRTNVIAFAKAWDGFAFRDAKSARSRRATQRELLVLKSHLEASLLEEDAPTAELAAARREHLELVAAREAAREPGVDYNRVLRHLEAELAQASEREAAPRVSRTDPASPVERGRALATRR